MVGVFVCGCVVIAPVARVAFAEAPPAADAGTPAPVQLLEARAGAPAIFGVARSLAPGWKATYGLGLAADTSLTSAFLRFDRALAADDIEERSDRDRWRHFLGLEFDAGDGLSLLGGVAKSSGHGSGKQATILPTGYERIRLNTGARWRGEKWGLDGNFAFIPTGATRYPGRSGFMPGTGGEDSGSTWLMSLSISRRF